MQVRAYPKGTNKYCLQIAVANEPIRVVCGRDSKGRTEIAILDFKKEDLKELIAELESCLR